MPELPEVETIRRQLEGSVVGKKITATEVLSTKRLNVSALELKKGTVGRKIVAVGRRAKILIIRLGGGWNIVIHLKMTGRVLLKNTDAAPTKHTFVVFNLSGGKKLMWEDYRRFGFLKLLSEAETEKYLTDQKFGPEPLQTSFSVAAFGGCLGRRPKIKIKQLLMDQTCVAGVGNIYAAEALFYARIRPDRPAGKLTPAEIAKLYKGMRQTLSESIKNRGTSADAYVDLAGKPGTNVPNLKVYDREGEPCLRRDGGVIKKTRLAQRGTFWCPVCQK
jgi:formamidopyrimidine-DNA glycosylase